MTTILQTLRKLSDKLSGINPWSLSTKDRDCPEHLTLAEWKLIGLDVLITQAVDWLELRRSPALASAFKARFNELRRLAQTAACPAETDKEKASSVLFLLEAYRFGRYIRQLCHVLEREVARKRAKKTSPLGHLRDPILVVAVVRAVGQKAGRSDKLAEKMRRRGYPIVKVAGKNYCQQGDAIAMLPRFRQRIERIAESSS